MEVDDFIEMTISSRKTSKERRIDEMLSVLDDADTLPCMDEEKNQLSQSKLDNFIEQHCHYLIIQMNALIKNISADILKLDQDDFDELKKAAMIKYNDLVKRTSFMLMFD